MEGLKLNDVVASALSVYLIRSHPPTKKELKRSLFPLIRGKVGPLMKEMNSHTIAKLQEKEDSDRHRRSLGY